MKKNFSKNLGLFNMGKGKGMILGIFILGLLIVGFIFFNEKFPASDFKSDLKQVISGTGNNYSFALDKDENTAWYGLDYNKFAYILFDYQKPVIFNGLKLLAGTTGGQISYLVSAQISNDGNYWTDVISADQTPYFVGKKWFKYDFLPKKARYIKIGIKVEGQAEKFNVYELEIN